LEPTSSTFAACSSSTSAAARLLEPTSSTLQAHQLDYWSLPAHPSSGAHKLPVVIINFLTFLLRHTLPVNGFVFPTINSTSGLSSFSRFLRICFSPRSGCHGGGEVLLWERTHIINPFAILRSVDIACFVCVSLECRGVVGGSIPDTHTRTPQGLAHPTTCTHTCSTCRQSHQRDLIATQSVC